MKYFWKILCSFIIINAFTYASQANITLIQQTISPRQLQNAQYQVFKEVFGAKNYLTLVSLKNLPKEGDVKFSIKRPLLQGTKLPVFRNYEIPMKELLRSLSQSKNGLPFHVVQSLGFLPGEEVELSVEVGQAKSNVLSFIPYPIKSTSKIDKATVSVKLQSISGGMYVIYCDHFRTDEEIEFKSESFGEVINTKINITPNFSMISEPAVIGKTGGNNKISIKRSNGETISLVIPWGDEAAKLAMQGA